MTDPSARICRDFVAGETVAALSERHGVTYLEIEGILRAKIRMESAEAVRLAAFVALLERMR